MQVLANDMYDNDLSETIDTNVIDSISDSVEGSIVRRLHLQLLISRCHCLICSVVRLVSNRGNDIENGDDS